MNESVVELAALAWLEDAGYIVVLGSTLAPVETGGERQRTGQMVLEGRLRDAVLRLNPDVPAEARDEAIRKALTVSSSMLVDANHAGWHYLARGVTVEHQVIGGESRYTQVRLVDFEDATENDWLATNQVTFTSGHQSRRVDVVLFLNGLPVVIIELKNAGSETATLLDAYRQLQTYQGELPELFTYNAVLAISDGFGARVGTLSSGFERFLIWRTVDGEELAPATMTQLEVLIRGALAPRRLLDLIRYYTVFEDDGESVTKKVAGYHQVHAVERALEATVEASKPRGDRRVGVVWHTQGSGKSLTMAFYAGRLVVHPAMRNPTIVVLTDRNDLDQQLFDTFARCQELLRQDPVQARDREHLTALLSTGSGGVVFTTIQKLFPEKGQAFPQLTDRRNVVVISDEAHRSQYDFIDGFARHLHDALPNASFIGFTGTPIELGDKSTRAVFGDHISVYDIARAVEDGATVPIFYESRLVPLSLDSNERPKIDSDFDEATEGEEIEGKEKLKTKWAALEALVGTEDHLARLAKNFVEHFEARLSAMDGKAMVVCMSRRICVDLYEAIRKLRPEWHGDDDNTGVMKVVITGDATDIAALKPHIRTKGRLKKLALHFKDPENPFQIVIVRDMWLTGFDAPSLHTMYIDKPMRGHSLMQAIARVNRVFRDKPGGLVVDFQGIGAELKDALQTYRESSGKNTDAAATQAAAVRGALAEYEICVGLFHGFVWEGWARGKPAERMSLLAGGANHILGLENGKERLLRSVTKLSRLFALAVPRPEVLKIRDDLAFFQVVRAGLVKSTVSERRSSGEVDHAIRQLVSKAITSEEVIDLMGAAGVKQRDISILSEEFLAELSALPQQNLAAELLRKLLDDEVKSSSRSNVVQSRSFAKLLDEAISRYRSRAIGAREVIDALIEVAREMKARKERDEALGLSVDEVAFYSALVENESAVEALTDENLRVMARELVELVKRNVSIDWTQKESVKAKLRVIVKRILRKHGYPPDKQEAATTTVLEQAELLSENWLRAS